jgi:hypothetical protein
MIIKFFYRQWPKSYRTSPFGYVGLCARHVLWCAVHNTRRAREHPHSTLVGGTVTVNIFMEYHGFDLHLAFTLEVGEEMHHVKCSTLSSDFSKYFHALKNF